MILNGLFVGVYGPTDYKDKFLFSVGIDSNDVFVGVTLVFLQGILM
jgi:hypothetical protein